MYNCDMEDDQMKKLNKPQKYSEDNVEFYSNEVTPVTPPSPPNNNNYPNNGGPGMGPGGGGGGANNNNGGPSFGDVLKDVLDKLLGGK